MRNDIRLKRAQARAEALSGAYQRELDELWFVNLLFVALPAVGSAAAAIVAALPNSQSVTVLWLPLASALAGGSAVLISIHKALKCDEYQAECLRLSQAYGSLSLRSDFAQDKPEPRREMEHAAITRRLEILSRDAKAKLPKRHRRWAEKRYGEAMAEPSIIAA